jgi:RNA polymerase sigma-70 factor (ECF subfamily)
MALVVDSAGVVLSSTDARLEDVEQYRRELTGYCYRMLGSAFEADDAVQETMVRAWKAFDSFEGRSSLRSWVYRNATNVCLDMHRGRKRRATPMDLGGPYTPEVFHGATRPESEWITPIPDDRVLVLDGDPAEVAATRETIKLAFVTALQHLPARQRAALILCEVLKWQATEAAELLDTSVASINSALQRARATLADRSADDARDVRVVDASQADLLARYVDAFERYDIDTLVTLLRDDVIMSMPPYDFWLTGPELMGSWFRNQGIGCKDGRILPAGTANGSAAFGTYRIDPAGGFSPWSLLVLEVSGDIRIVGNHSFLDTSLFEVFGLPAHLDA